MSQWPWRSEKWPDARADIVDSRQGATVRRAEIRTDFLNDRLERLDDNRRAQYATQAAALRSYRSERVERELELAKIRPARFEAAESSRPAGWQNGSGARISPSARPAAAVVAARQAEIQPQPVARRPMSRSPLAATSTSSQRRPPATPYLAGSRDPQLDRVRLGSTEAALRSRPGLTAQQSPGATASSARGGIPAAVSATGSRPSRSIAQPGSPTAASRLAQRKTALEAAPPALGRTPVPGSPTLRPSTSPSATNRPGATAELRRPDLSRPASPTRPSLPSRTPAQAMTGPRPSKPPAAVSASRSSASMASRSAQRDAARRELVEEVEARRERRTRPR